jgi:hypothetical protein
MALAGFPSNVTSGKSERLHRLPRQQQLQLHRSKYGLLRVSPGGVEQYAFVWRRRAESHYRGLSDLAVFAVSRHDCVDGFNVQSREHGFPADQLASDRTSGEGYRLRSVPQRQLLIACDSADRLRQFAVPPDDLAADQ